MKKASYLFNLLAVGIVLISAVIYFNFEHTKNEIYSINNSANQEYVNSLAENLSNDIMRVSEGDLSTELKDDAILKEYVEADLKLFVTTKYRYIYLISKDQKFKNGFTILADSAKNSDERNALTQMYKQLDKDKVSEIYLSKRYRYIKHKYLKGIGATYLKPIIVNDTVEAILVIDFSLQEQKTITSALLTLQDMFQLAIVFFIIVFLLILWFSNTDRKREKEKNEAFRKLKTSNKSLEMETAKVLELNQTLEHKVKEEVNKNRVKEALMLQQSRLAQMGEMISMIAHQWRQPLSAISSTSAVINLKAKIHKLDEEKALELSSKIGEYAQHLSLTIDDFRGFFKSNKEKRTITYSELIDSVLSIIEVSMKSKNMTLNTSLDCTQTLYTYSNELKQVILNLIKNAEDILVENKIRNPFIKIATFKEDDYLVLSVSDNGGGIPEDIIENIFDPYFSTKTEKNGTGLGLYMSKIIIEDHCGGKLIAYNNKEGAVFKIMLRAE